MLCWWYPGPVKGCSYACTVIDWTMPVKVGTFKAQLLQYAHQTGIGAQRKRSTPTGTTDTEICFRLWLNRAGKNLVRTADLCIMSDFRMRPGRMNKARQRQRNLADVVSLGVFSDKAMCNELLMFEENAHLRL